MIKLFNSAITANWITEPKTDTIVIAKEEAIWI